jgi:hypothetical protein
MDPVYQPKLVAHAFQGAATPVFQQMATENPNASAQKLWDLMKEKLYNTAQVQNHRARFNIDKMKKDKTVEEFAKWLRQLASGLTVTTTGDLLLQRPRDGLSSALKVKTLAVAVKFGAVVSQVGQIADAIGLAASN